MFYMLRNEYYCFYLSFSITGDEILSKNFSNSKYSGSNSNTRTSKPLLLSLSCNQKSFFVYSSPPIFFLSIHLYSIVYSSVRIKIDRIGQFLLDIIHTYRIIKFDNQNAILNRSLINFYAIKRDSRLV
mgnify:FL=1